jgi:DNA-binding MarR family transcriptional regulator
MDQIVKLETGRWLRRRDAWMRGLVGNEFVSRNGKLVGFHLALRLSAKKPYCYPAMRTIGKALGISPRHVARALKELEDEQWVRVRRQPGRSSVYSLDL